MTALWRINLWVTLFFTLVAALGMLLLLRQASTDVQREMRAAQAMVDYLHVAASRDPASLHSGLAGNLRHIRITPLTNPELTPPARQAGDGRISNMSASSAALQGASSATSISTGADG